MVSNAAARPEEDAGDEEDNVADDDEDADEEDEEDEEDEKGDGVTGANTPLPALQALGAAAAEALRGAAARQAAHSPTTRAEDLRKPMPRLVAPRLRNMHASSRGTQSASSAAITGSLSRRIFKSEAEVCCEKY